MKKFKHMLPGLFLALALIFGSAASVKVYANGDDPQGGSKSTSAPAPPPPPPGLVDLIAALLWFL
ncbi:MAG: hypothetical protein ACREEM_04305 [Blastocatellia bacterium]